MEISSSKLNLQLHLIEVDALRPHEEVVDPLVESLAVAIRREGIVRDPLIVDKQDYVVLDGMHRYNALRLLGCRFAPCCLVDYDSPLIKIGSWFRLVIAKQPEELSESLLTKHNLPYSKRQIDPERARDDSHSIILTKNGVQYSLPQPSDLVVVTRTAVMLEREMIDLGHSVEYQPEAVALQRLEAGKTDLVITVPIFTKQQVREFGIGGLLLPHKVTRHIIPSRPLRIDVPLSLLKDREMSQSQADRKFGELLSSRRVDKKPAGTIIDGRRYDEELLVFAV